MVLESTNSLFAYVGPGGGIALIGSLIMLVLAIASAVGFVLFWPLRSMFRKAKGTPPATEARPDEAVNPETPAAV